MASGYIRKLIDEATQGNLKDVYLGIGEVYFIPSTSELGAFYLVVRVPKRGWLCECKGFRFGGRGDANCQHVDRAKEKRAKLKKKGR